jgi:hypothetical protein
MDAADKIKTSGNVCCTRIPERSPGFASGVSDATVGACLTVHPCITGIPSHSCAAASDWEFIARGFSQSFRRTVTHTDSYCWPLLLSHLTKIRMRRQIFVSSLLLKFMIIRSAVVELLLADRQTANRRMFEPFS